MTLAASLAIMNSICGLLCYFVLIRLCLYGSFDVQVFIGHCHLDGRHSFLSCLLWCILQDSFELEEDINSNGPSSQLAEGRGKLEISAADQKPLCAAEPTSKPAALLEVRTPSGVLGKKSDTETPDSGATAVKNTIFLPSAGSQSRATASNKETNVDKVPPFVFSSSTQVTGSKPGSSSRLVPAIIYS